MFVIPNMFVEDKHLHKVLSALQGLVIKMDVPRPVVNAVHEKGQIKQVSTAVSFKGRLIELLKAKSGSLISTTALKDMYIELGANPSSMNSTLLGGLIDEKVLRRKERGLYHIL